MITCKLIQVEIRDVMSRETVLTYRGPEHSGMGFFPLLIPREGETVVVDRRVDAETPACHYVVTNVRHEFKKGNEATSSIIQKIVIYVRSM